MTGEIIVDSGEDTPQPWVAVRIDGTHKHIVFSHASDVRRIA